jgi:transcriptional regulator with XRE-family HTH domain
MEPGPRPIPNRLRMHRKMMGLKQHQVAQLLGVYDTKPLSMWEKGIVIPSTINLLKLSIIYRTFPNELYYEKFTELREELKALELQQFIN